MAKKTKSFNHWNGWLVLDKPAGMSSAAAVGKVKRLLQPRKIGHGGTLDPLATGILPLALGEATKMFAYVVANTKTYCFTIRWGEQRTTDDAEGEAIKTTDVRPSKEAIEALLPEFTGEVMQVPPIFSAISQGGQRAYALARAGEEVQLEARPVQIDELRLLSIDDADHATFEMTCGKGTYVRSVARDLGEKLGCYGYVSMLRRTKVGKFDENGAISLEKLEELVHSAALKERLLPIASVLDDILALELDQIAVHRLTHGQSAMLPPELLDQFEDEAPTTALVTHQQQPVAMAEVMNGEVRPVRVFNLNE